jgi:FKBP-type peptidyl-prolyl cis-trans isomerase
MASRRPCLARPSALLLLALTGAAVGAQAPTPEPAGAPPTLAPQVGSYDLGLMVGTQLVNSGVGSSLSREALLRGMDDALAGKVPTPEQREAAQQYAHTAREALAKKNGRLAQEFLSKNRGAPGIKTLASGLQYRVLAEGDSHAPAVGPLDQVRLNYTLSLPDGKVLDRSDAHSQAAIFRVNSVIPAWREALMAMRPGAKWQLFVPPELGYGANSPPPIPPGGLVEYELELVATQPPPAMPTQPGGR